MDSRIPLPTDNIFKLYALFGLLLLIFSIASALYVNKSTNDLIFETAVNYETLKEAKKRSASQEVHFKLLQKKLEIADSNKSFFIFCLAFIAVLGSLMMWYGFKKWHTEVQPIQDEIARLNLKRLRREAGEDESV